MSCMNCPTPIEGTYKNMIFIITHNPTKETLNKVIEKLKKYGIPQ